MRSLILDMDGTLVNTALATVPACTIVSRRLGLKVHDEDFVRGLIGWPDMVMFRKMYPQANNKTLERYFIEVVKEEKLIIGKLGSKMLFEDAYDTLTKLKGNGFFLVLASTATDHHMNVCMEATQIGKFFETRKFGHYDKKIMIEEILEEYPGRSWIMVGDRIIDKRAVEAFGIPAVYASYGFGSEEEGEVFDFYIEKPSDILEVIKKVEEVYL